ncbi:MAG: L,D-transpeptidase family protein, partial [Chlorobium limicola]|nr:L,D-transpeptidase family protein [Chlorobium limicola]
GLSVDGVAGTATIGEINISAAERVDQIRLNLERYRWFVNDLEPTYVLVNIAGFTLQYIENGRYRWGTRVIVGKPYRETPVFKADMQYIVFNPQWVIPPTILAEDALPAIRNSRSYLDRKKLRVIDSRGRVVDPASVNWSGYSAANFPYRLQQTAGDHGALGRIKFMMPNKHVIYLHDTPTKNLFEKSERTFSSGCIRVENPLDLAQLVLQDSVKWNKTSIDSTIGTGKTSTVNLPKRIPVFLLYLTAIAEGEEIQFRRDVYNRDDRLRKALDSPVPQYRIESCGL